MDILFVLKNIVILSLISNVNSFDIDFKILENFLTEEISLISSAKEYLLKEEKRLTDLRVIINEIDDLNSVAIKDKQRYLDNSLNIYHLIKRMAKVWPEVQEKVKTNDEIISELKLQKQSIISEKKFSDHIKELLYLVNTYGLDIKSLVDGITKYGISSGNQKFVIQSNTSQMLDAFDCYLMGRQSYVDNDIASAKQWLNIALKRVNNRTNDEIIADILRYSSLVSYRDDDYDNAIKYLNQSLDVNKNEDFIDSDKVLLDLMSKVFDERADEEVDEGVDEEEDEEEDNEDMDQVSDQTIAKSDNIYSNLCRGERLLNETIESKLKCFYLNTNLKPFLRLTRIKCEELYKRPQIVFIHDFLSDKETDVLKMLSMNRLKRTTIVNNDGKQVPARDRRAYGLFLASEDDITVDTINTRIGALTGLDIQNSDDMNVIKYGVGGFYAPHYDAYLPRLNRISTFITYLSDVEVGGYTVFPLIGVSAQPKKGSALFWYNILSSGDQDMNTLHSGCPVVVGYKWIATKWTYSGGQVFRKPCSVDKDDYNLLENN